MRIRIAVFVCFALVFAGCGGDQPASRSAKGQEKRAAPPPPVPCPLTGELKAAGTDLGHPALAVKIENSLNARPQAGLEFADLVFEELAEGGITRFMAVYHCSEASSVGPVRSARMVDADLLLEFVPALFGYSGANKDVLRRIQSKKGIVSLQHGNHGEAYRRAAGRPAPHNLFTSTEKLRALDDAKGVRGAPKTGLSFVSSLPEPSPKASSSAVVTGTSVSFSFTGAPGPKATRFTYEPEAGAYLRFHGETPHKADSGKQLSAVNLVILKVTTSEGTIRDAAGNYSPEIEVVGGGEAIVLRGGLVATGRWSRRSLSDHLSLVDSAGKPIPLLTGNTWIELLPSTQKVSIQ